MRYLLRQIFHKHWYSICSAHHILPKDCPRCNNGHWVINRWKVEREGRRFRSYRAAAIARGEAVDTDEFYQQWVREGLPDGS